MLKNIYHRDDLEILEFLSEQELGAAAAVEGGRRIASAIKAKGHCRIIFAAAVSQHELLKALSVNESINWEKVTAFHMDEYFGIPEGDSRSLASFFRKYPKITPRKFHFLDSMTLDREKECLRYSDLLREDQIDVVFCGIGDNGHLAFNEPHAASFRDSVWVKPVLIDDVSKQQQVNAGNFPNMQSVPSEAYTLTIPALMSGNSLICIAPTHYKSSAVRDILLGPVSEKYPASIIRRHKNAVLYLDIFSAEKIQGSLEN